MVRFGICGTNNSHAVVYTKLLHDTSLPAAERVEGAEVAAFFAYDEENVEALRSLGVVTQVERPEDLIPLVDAVLCVTRDGSKHLAEATPFLRAGVTTFVDKPLAVSVADARALVELAQRTGTPLMSCSALRYAPEIQELQAHLEELGELRCGTATGMGETIFYGVHTVEMMNAVFGGGVEFVVNVGPEGHDMGVAQYADGKTVSIQIMREAKVDFRLVAHGTEGRREAAVKGSAFYPESLRRVVEFARSGQSPVALEDSLEIIKVLNGLVLSRQRGERVYLREL